MAYRSAADLLVPGDVNGGILGCNLACGNCIHFAKVAAVTLDGTPTLCSSNKIGRLPTSSPCQLFQPDPLGLTMSNLPKKFITRYLKLLRDLAKEQRYKNRVSLLAQDMIAHTGAWAHSVKNGKGLVIGSRVGIVGTNDEGELLFIDYRRGYATILMDAAKEADRVRLTTPIPKVRKALQREDEEQQQAEPKPKKKPAAKKTTPAKKPATKSATKKAEAKKPAAKKSPAKKPTKKEAAKAKPATAKKAKVA